MAEQPKSDSGTIEISAKLVVIGFIALLIIMAIVPLVLAGYRWAYGFACVNDVATLGQIGDQFGIANAFFSGLALIGVAGALLLQSQQIKRQEQEIREQGALLKKQAFDGSFFSLLRIMKESVDDFVREDGPGSTVHSSLSIQDTYDVCSKVTKRVIEYAADDGVVEQALLQYEGRPANPADRFPSPIAAYRRNLQPLVATFVRVIELTHATWPDASMTADLYIRVAMASMSVRVRQIVLWMVLLDYPNMIIERPTIAQFAADRSTVQTDGGDRRATSQEILDAAMSVRRVRTAWDSAR